MRKQLEPASYFWSWWQLSRQREPLTVTPCHPNWLLSRYSLTILSIYREICTRMWCLLKRAACQISIVVWRLSRMLLQHEYDSTSGGWHVRSGNHSSEFNDSSFSCKARFGFNWDYWQKRGSHVLPWLSRLCKPEQHAAQDKDIWGDNDAGTFRNVLKAGE